MREARRPDRPALWLVLATFGRLFRRYPGIDNPEIEGGLVVDFGLAGFPARPDEVDRMTHYRTVLEMLPSSFSTVWISDHFQFGRRPTVEGWTLLTYLAAAFPRFRYGHLVLAQSYRNPAMLAKMSATLQELTGGRFILGLGAGWREEEYRAYGFDYPSGGVRVAQLAEAIEVIRAMWTQSPATYHGTYYNVENAYCEPQPDPPIPIMVGTNGKKALGVTARLADWWTWDGPWETVYRPAYETLRALCETIGRPFEQIVLTSGVNVNMPDDPSTFERTYDHEFYPGQTFYNLGPTAADVIQEIEELADVGVTHFQIAFEDVASVRRFVEEVVPAIRPQAPVKA
jgi:alkanesulfonate monooxygenase SsuD/methylene tetrahydromethanopterin reductase-like flavin-dependent oxidoreductase (luciferase family)